jgi:methionyl-tRNA formyltransferase
VRIVYCGLDLGIGVLRTLLEHGHEIVGLRYAVEPGQQGSALADLARDAGIPASPERPDAAGLAGLAGQGVELLLVNGYPHRLPIGGAAVRAVNMHPSLLPEGRGPWPFPWTILKGLERSGVTTHKLVDAMDQGDILHQTAYPVAPDETFDSLLARYQMAAPMHALELLADFDRFWDEATPQTGGSAWPDTTRADCTLDWSHGIAQIARVVRAFGSSGCFAVVDGAALVVRSVDCWSEAPRHSPGTVVPETAPALVVAAADGYVLMRDAGPEAPRG